MKRFMNPRAFGALVASIVLAAGLVACGGGGGGGDSVAVNPPTTVTPPVVVDKTAPVLTLATASPASITTTVVVTSNEQMAGLVAVTVQSPDGSTVTGSTVPNAGNMGMTWTSAAGPLACNTVYKVSAQGADLAGNTGVLSGTVTTVACQNSYWNPKPTFAPMGTKVFGANQLPAGCTSTLQQCWKDSVANGMVKFISTSATMTGINTRPIVFAYYVTADGTRWNTQPFYSDTGDSIAGNGEGSLTGGGTFNIDMVVGNTPGVVFRVGGSCWQVKWYPAGDPSGNANVWATTPVACPQ